MKSLLVSVATFLSACLAAPTCSAFSSTRGGPFGVYNLATVHYAEKKGFLEEYCDVETTPNYLFDRIGGEPALNAAVDGLYERLVVDEQVGKYFEGIAMDKLMEHQYNFMQMAFTEIPEGCDIAGMLTTGHTRLWAMGLDESDFDVVAGHFVATLQSLDVDQELIDEAVGVIAPLRDIFEEKGHQN